MCCLLCSPPFVQFICAGMWGCGVLPTTLPAPFSATLSLSLSVYLCGNVGPQGLLVVRLPAQFLPHSSSLSPAMPGQCESFPPQLPISAPPTGLDECLFFISLVSDFLAIRFSVSSGCERRRSVSTYTAILVLYGLELLMAPLLVGSPLQRVYCYLQCPSCLICSCTGVD